MGAIFLLTSQSSMYSTPALEIAQQTRSYLHTHTHARKHNLKALSRHKEASVKGKSLQGQKSSAKGPEIMSEGTYPIPNPHITYLKQMCNPLFFITVDAFQKWYSGNSH